MTASQFSYGGNLTLVYWFDTKLLLWCVIAVFLRTQAFYYLLLKLRCCGRQLTKSTTSTAKGGPTISLPPTGASYPQGIDAPILFIRVPLLPKKKCSSISLIAYHVVSFAAVFRDVTQRSPEMPESSVILD